MMESELLLELLFGAFIKLVGTVRFRAGLRGVPELTWDRFGFHNVVSIKALKGFKRFSV